MDAQAIDKGIFRDGARAGFHELDVRGDIEPGRHLKIVENLHTTPVTRAKQRARQWAELRSGADEIPADTKAVAPVFPKGAIAAKPEGEKVPDGRGVAVAEGGASEQAPAALGVFVELDEVLIETVVDRPLVGQGGEPGDRRFGVLARRRFVEPEIGQIDMLPHAAHVLLPRQIKEAGLDC